MKDKNPSTVSKVFIVAFGIVMVSLSFIVPLMMDNSGDRSDHSVYFNSEYECESDCVLVRAETWTFNDPCDWESLAFVSDVTFHLQYLDFFYIRFNKDYIVRVYFNVNLTKGDKILMYAKWNTVPWIKNATVYLPNGTKAGGGQVFSKRDWYYLEITENVDSNVFDISIDCGTPSYQKMYVNIIKCGKLEGKGWHDEGGTLVTHYKVNLNYIVNVSGIVNDNPVYLDIEIHQAITDNITADPICASMMQRETVEIVATGFPSHYESSSIPLLSRENAGTDNITISIDVFSTVYGRINGTDDWIVVDDAFLSLRIMTFRWY